LQGSGGYVKWSDIKDYAERYLSDARLEGTQHVKTESRWIYGRDASLYDYLHTLWNSPHRPLSPPTYFMGVLIPAGVDDNGDIIYLFNYPFVEHGIKVFDAEKIKRMVGWDDEKVRRGEPLPVALNRREGLRSDSDNIGDSGKRV